VEVERLQRDYDLGVEFAPFLLDPTTPPEGKPRRPQTRPDSPPTPLEERGERLGIRFSRGRTITSNSHLALEAAEFAAARGRGAEFDRRMFRAYFEDLEDIGRLETVLRVGRDAGLDEPELREVLVGAAFRASVDEDIDWARRAGVSAIPTFIFDGRNALVGAHEQEVLRQVVERVLAERQPLR
jgi:predicted DsbA family dithiol-disulfide isomerase